MDNGRPAEKDFLAGRIEDLPHQFKGKKRIDGLLYALARQFEDLICVAGQLREERWLLNAEGRQLDGIGDIVCMTRVEATELELQGKTVSSMNDGRYRDYLAYKMFLNASWCTRSEIMRSLRFFFDEFTLYYAEDPAHPATIFIDTPPIDMAFPVERLTNLRIPKPAGVQFQVRVKYVVSTVDSLVGLFIGTAESDSFDIWVSAGNLVGRVYAGAAILTDEKAAFDVAFDTALIALSVNAPLMMSFERAGFEVSVEAPVPPGYGDLHMTTLSSNAPVVLTCERVALGVWAAVSSASAYIGLSLNTFEREAF